MKRGKNARPILKSDIEIAQANTLSAQQAATYLNLAYNTYKKYAKVYGIWKTNPHSIGIKKTNRGRYQIQEDVLKEVLEGKRPHYNRFRLKGLLIKYGFLQEECAVCGFKEQRITDLKVPLYLDYRDGNRGNFKIENLRFLCLNHTFLLVGDLNGHKIEYRYHKE